MSTKRPSCSSSNSGSAIKKPRRDEVFLKPSSGNGPNFNRLPSLSIRNKPSTSNAQNIKTIPRAKSPLVNNFLDDFDDFDDFGMDEVLLVASQNAELEEERKRNQKLQQLSEECGNAEGSSSRDNKFFKSRESTQKFRNGNQNVFSDKAINNHFVDLTEDLDPMFRDQIENPTITNDSRYKKPLQNQPVPTSQKENATSHVATQVMIKEKKIKALEIQLKNKMVQIDAVQEKLRVKEGEAGTLRREKKLLEEKVRGLCLNNATQVTNDPEKNKLRQERDALKIQLDFEKLNARNMRIAEQPQPTSSAQHTSTIPFFTNFSAQTTSGKLEVSSKMFDIIKPLPNPEESFKMIHNEETSVNVDTIETQLKIAKACANLLNGGFIDNRLINELFIEASSMILHIEKYIEDLECRKDDIIFDNNPSLTASIFISIPFLRKKLTTFNPVLNTLDKNDGVLNVAQSGKLFPEEICSNPRQIIACYAVIARYSQRFSENLLMSNINDGSTFVSVLCQSLMTYVSDSKNVFDYFGFTIASASLLSSLGSHYSEYSSDYIEFISEMLTKMFRVLLECRCDSPLIMEHLTEFLVSVTKDPERTEFAQQLCVNYPSKEIAKSRFYRYSLFNPAACSFQLFLMYLQTAFNLRNELNQFELQLLLKTTLNLNRIISNIQEMKPGTVQFLETSENDQSENICGCLSNTIYALLTLNHLAMANRNFDVTFSRHVEGIHTQGRNAQEIHKPEMSKSHCLMKEIVKGCITSVADLFMRVDSKDFPLENLVFLGYLEQLCNWIKEGNSWDNDNNRQNCWKIYNCGLLEDSFNTMSIRPNFLENHENEDESMVQNEGDNVQDDKVERCRETNNAELLDDTM